MTNWLFLFWHWSFFVLHLHGFCFVLLWLSERNKNVQTNNKRSIWKSIKCSNYIESVFVCVSVCLIVPAAVLCKHAKYCTWVVIALWPKKYGLQLHFLLLWFVAEWPTKKKTAGNKNSTIPSGFESLAFNTNSNETFDQQWLRGCCGQPTNVRVVVVVIICF